MLPLLELLPPELLLDEPPPELLEVVSELGTQLPFSQVASPLQSVSEVHSEPVFGDAEHPTNDWSVKTNVPTDKQNPTQRMVLLVIMHRAYPSEREYVNALFAAAESELGEDRVGSVAAQIELAGQTHGRRQVRTALGDVDGQIQGRSRIARRGARPFRDIARQVEDV